jgi:hypothetical protein
MTDLFEDKSAMPDNANVKRAPSGASSDAPVRVSQTLNERYADRADDAMSVRNLSRPRRGYAY